MQSTSVNEYIYYNRLLYIIWYIKYPGCDVNLPPHGELRATSCMPKCSTILSPDINHNANFYGNGSLLFLISGNVIKTIKIFQFDYPWKIHQTFFIRNFKKGKILYISREEVNWENFKVFMTFLEIKKHKLALVLTSDISLKILKSDSRHDLTPIYRPQEICLALCIV